jgi:ferritin-like metal-binding protein YciE
MAGIDSLEALMQAELKDIYDAEKQLTKALPKMAKKATAEELKTAIEEHLRQTEQHIERLDQVFEQLGIPARGMKCEGMKYLIKEGDDMIGEAADDSTRDAVMIASAQKVEHYEIAAYGTLRTWANVLGQTEAAALFGETLEEEKQADQKLTQIAEAFVNQASAEEGGEEEEGEEQAAPRGRGPTASASSRGRQQAADRAGRSGGRSGSSGSRRKSR